MSKKILIIEDNKALAKAIAAKIKSAFGFEVDIAYSQTESKLFLLNYQIVIRPLCRCS